MVRMLQLKLLRLLILLVTKATLTLLVVTFTFGTVPSGRMSVTFRDRLARLVRLVLLVQLAILGRPVPLGIQDLQDLRV